MEVPAGIIAPCGQDHSQMTRSQQLRALRLKLSCVNRAIVHLRRLQADQEPDEEQRLESGLGQVVPIDSARNRTRLDAVSVPTCPPPSTTSVVLSFSAAHGRDDNIKRRQALACDGATETQIHEIMRPSFSSGPSVTS
jgi:hypothetical protein